MEEYFTVVFLNTGIFLFYSVYYDFIPAQNYFPLCIFLMVDF
jgi:hypothetical protein